MSDILDKTLTKHIATVHNSSALNVTQRKIMNIFLGNALLGDAHEEKYTISMRRIREALGWGTGSKTTALLKEDLRELAKMQIEWNVLNVDKKNKWIAMQLLSEVSMDGENVSYAYPPTLRDMLFRPNIFAKLNMRVQQKIKRRHSLILWELLCGEFCLKKSLNITTRWFSFDEFLRLNGLENSIYCCRYSEFLARVIEAPIEELNDKSDILVKYDVERLGRKIERIRFKATKKDKVDFVEQIVYDPADDVRGKMQKLGFKDRLINEISTQYDVSDIDSALLVYEERLSSSSIKYPVAFLKKALKEGWIVSADCNGVEPVALKSTKTNLLGELSKGPQRLSNKTKQPSALS